MSSHQVLAVGIISFLLGVGLFDVVFQDLEMIFWIILALAALSLIFVAERWVRILGLAAVSFFLGLGYAGWLGREKLVSLSENFWLVEALTYLRLKFETILSQVLPFPHSVLASGLIVGIKSGFPAELKQAFITTGTIHIVAISGFNVTLVIKIFADWIRGWGRVQAFVIGSLMIVAFVILVGGQPSVVRAGIMGWLFLLAKFLYRQPYMVNALLLSALLMVLQEPAILLKDIGFQLSFAAMLGLIYFSPIIKQGIDGWRYSSWLPKKIREVFIETIGAQIMVAPLLVFHFGRISLLSPIPNLLILPLIMVPMALGFWAALAGWVWLPLASLIAYPLFYFLSYFIKVVEIFSQVPGMNVHIEMSFWWLLAIYLCLTLVVYLIYRKYHSLISEKS